MNSQVALQTQSGSADSGTGGALELRCRDVSRGCSVATFMYCHESLTTVVLKTGGSLTGRWAYNREGLNLGGGGVAYNRNIFSVYRLMGL